MDGSSTTDNSTPERDHLLYHLGHAYRFLLLGDARASCYHLLKFGSRDICRAFLDAIAQDLAMRHRLWLEALYWAAYFGEGVGHDHLGWLTEQVFAGRLGWYEVICTGPHRGEPQKLNEKQVRAALSSGMDNLPVVGSGKSLIQAVTGVDLITDEPVNRWIEGVGVIAGVAPGGKRIVKKVSEKLGEAGSIRNVNPKGGTQNCVNCVIATDATLSKAPASALPGGPTSVRVLERQFGGTFKMVSGRSEIEDLMTAAGDGARGIVYGNRGNQVGHVFNAVNQKGTIRFLDGQSGKPASFEGFSGFQFLKTN